jgi:hypothetical protein
MKESRFALGTGIVQQVSYLIERKQEPQAVHINDNDFISWKLIKIFAVVAVIKVIIFFILL